MDQAFNRIKKIVESSTLKSKFDCLKTIVLNVSEVCNMECQMCPRSHGYKNSDHFMSLDIVSLISEQLHHYNYKGIVSISGMGEPCFNKDLINICKILNDFNVQVITNGTLDYDYKKLSAYANILVSIHDWDHIDFYRNRFSGIDVIFRNHDLSNDGCELKVTNRSGWLNIENSTGICNYPFYKTLIDYDGCYLLCADDWARISKVKDVNISKINIKNYFCDYLENVKHKIIQEGRLSEPCNHCNTNGVLIGSNIVEWYIVNDSERTD